MFVRVFLLLLFFFFSFLSEQKNIIFLYDRRMRMRERGKKRVVLNRLNVVKRSSAAFFNRIRTYSVSSMIAQCIHIYLDTFFRLVAGTAAAAVSAGRETDIVAGHLLHLSFRSSHQYFFKFRACPCALVDFTNKLCMFYFTFFLSNFWSQKKNVDVVFFHTKCISFL